MNKHTAELLEKHFDTAFATPDGIKNPTLGLILCPEKIDAVVNYTLGEQQQRNIFATRYQLHLPTEEKLQRDLRRQLGQLMPPVSAPAVKKKEAGK